MPLLYHWRGDNHRRDLDYGVGYHLNQANPTLSIFTAVETASKQKPRAEAVDIPPGGPSEAVKTRWPAPSKMRRRRLRTLASSSTTSKVPPVSDVLMEADMAASNAEALRRLFGQRCRERPLPIV